jgi:hypothetical protein
MCMLKDPMMKQDQDIVTSNTNLESASQQVKRQSERVIHQQDIYYEEESSTNALFTVHNAAIVILYSSPEEDEKENGLLGNAAGDVEKSIRRSPNRRLDKESINQGDFHIIYYIDIEYIGTYDQTMYIVKNVRYTSSH